MRSLSLSQSGTRRPLRPLEVDFDQYCLVGTPDGSQQLPLLTFLTEKSCHRDPSAMTARFSNAWSEWLNRCLKERGPWTRVGLQANPKGKQLAHGRQGDRQSSYPSDCDGVWFPWSFLVIRVNSLSLRVVSEATLSGSKKGGEAGRLLCMGPLRSGQTAVPVSPQSKEATTTQEV